MKFDDFLTPVGNRLGLGDADGFYTLAVMVDGTLPFNFIGRPMEIAFNMIQGLDMEEPAAVQVVPTQNKGKFVEHQGNIFKNINIKGTTGIRPNKNTPGGIAVLPFGNIGATPGIPNTEKTGFDDLVDLVNLFRMYFYCKEDVSLAPKTIMVWKNGREGEYWVVEPMTFKTSRSSSSPMTTSYDISLKTIERYAFTRPEDKQAAQFDKNWRQRLKQLTAELSASYARINALQDNFISAGARFITDILQPANDLLNALTAFGETSRRISEVPRYAVANLASNVKDAAEAMDELAFNYTDGLSDTNKFISHQLRVMLRSLNGIYNETALFSAEASDRTNRKIRAYENVRVSSTSTSKRGDLLSLDSGAALVDINLGEDIRKVAKRLVGDVSAWKSLVILNDLKPPYISATGDGTTVLRPGVDKILIPATNAAATSISRHATSRPDASSLYGRDVKLGPLINGVRSVAIGQNGDFATIEGIPNVRQAVDIKLNVEQGELPAHKTFGIKFPIGVRANSAQSLTEFNINTRNTLLSDTRITTINKLAFRLDGNTILMKGDISLIDGNDSLSLNLEVRK